MARNTTTGTNYEKIVDLCLEQSAAKHNLIVNKQVNVGKKPNDGDHFIDRELVARDNPDRRGLVSCKTQNVGGTAEEKLPYEVLKLIYAMRNDPRYLHAWLVLGGTGWSPGMKKYVAEDLVNDIPEMRGKVTVVINTDIFLSMDLDLPAAPAAAANGPTAQLALPYNSSPHNP